MSVDRSERGSLLYWPNDWHVYRAAVNRQCQDLFLRGSPFFTVLTLNQLLGRHLPKMFDFLAYRNLQFSKHRLRFRIGQVADLVAQLADTIVQSSGGHRSDCYNASWQVHTVLAVSLFPTAFRGKPIARSKNLRRY
jgi:hypothetical protein